MKSFLAALVALASIGEKAMREKASGSPTGSTPPSRSGNGNADQLAANNITPIGPVL
jgi:hypothetical protein